MQAVQQQPQLMNRIATDLQYGINIIKSLNKRVRTWETTISTVISRIMMNRTMIKYNWDLNTKIINKNKQQQQQQRSMQLSYNTVSTLSNHAISEFLHKRQ